MADETNTTNEVANNGQAAPKPVDNAFGHVDATPAPSATATNAEPAPADAGDANPQNGDISNPEAYYKAQAEKFERLFRKAEEQATAATLKLKDREGEDVQQINQQLETLRAELQAERQKAEQERLTALKLRIGAQHNLDPEIAMRLVGDDEAALSEDAQKLAAKVVPTNQRKASTGNPAGNSDGKPTWGHRIDPWTGN